MFSAGDPASRTVQLGFYASGPRNVPTTRPLRSSSGISPAAATGRRRRSAVSRGVRSKLRGCRTVSPTAFGPGCSPRASSAPTARWPRGWPTTCAASSNSSQRRAMRRPRHRRRPRALPSSEGSVTSTDSPELVGVEDHHHHGSQSSGRRCTQILQPLRVAWATGRLPDATSLTAFEEYGPIALGQWYEPCKDADRAGVADGAVPGPGDKRLRAKPNEPKRLANFSMLVFSSFSRRCSRGRTRGPTQEPCAGQIGWRSSQSIT